MQKIILIAILTITTAPLWTSAYAEFTYDINIPSGSADPNAPFHWSSEKDGDTSGFIEITVNDQVQWKNADTVEHTVTSGTPQTGPDGVFDSGHIDPGKFYMKKFTEIGKFPYYCSLHPWRTGLVNVVSGYSSLPNVASDIGDGKTTFNLEYKFNRLLDSAIIDEDAKSITFALRGKPMSEDGTLTVLLPSSLISGVDSVSIDGVPTEKFSQKFENDQTILAINEIPQSSKSITVTGATIIPEFADLALMVLITALAILVFITRGQNKIAKKVIQS